MGTNILMESGTNELEVLEFAVGGNYYGINVAKVKEIIPYSHVTPVPNCHPYIEGIFMPRDIMMSVVNLKKVLLKSEQNLFEVQDQKDTSKNMFIVTNFNKINIAFHVDSVIGIHRVSWSEIVKPDETLSNIDNGISTAIMKKDDKLLIILDFERIVSDICPDTGLKIDDIKQFTNRKECSSHILITEDSPLLIKLISDSLIQSGYTNLTLCMNGQEAWNYLMRIKKGELPNDIKCVITDIEMPLMDGHTLTKNIKNDDMLNEIPVIIFSSLINEQMMLKGESVGADYQLSKPEIGELVGVVDKVLL